MDLPTSGELNSFRGVLSWAQRKQGVVIAKCVFHPGGAVRRKVSNQKMCRIFDYPTNRFSEMTEQAKELLTDNNIPGKVVLDAIHFLDKWNNTGGRVPTPAGVSVALALVDITEEERKRKEHVGAESTCPQKQRRVGIQSPSKVKESCSNDGGPAVDDEGGRR